MFLIFWPLELRKKHGEPWFLNLIFTYFPIMNNWGKFVEISSVSFYCIIPPEPCDTNFPQNGQSHAKRCCSNFYTNFNVCLTVLRTLKIVGLNHLIRRSQMFLKIVLIVPLFLKYLSLLQDKTKTLIMIPEKEIS